MTQYILSTPANLENKATYDKVISIIAGRGQPFEPRVVKHKDCYELSWRSEHSDIWYNMTQGPEMGALREQQYWRGVGKKEVYEPDIPATGPFDAVPDLITSLVNAGAISFDDFQHYVAEKDGKKKWVYRTHIKVIA